MIWGLNWTKAKNFEKALDSKQYLSKAVEICMNDRLYFPVHHLDSRSQWGSFENPRAPILGNYGHALGMSGETEKGVAFESVLH